MGKDLDRHIPEDVTQIANKVEKSGLASLTISKMQIKIAM